MGGDVDGSRGQLPDALCGSYYARFFWDDIHVGPRKLDLRVLRDWFSRAARRKLRLSWRLNPLSPGDGGDTDHAGITWMRDGGWPGFSFDWQSQQNGPIRRLWHFDLEATKVRDELAWLAKTLAAEMKNLAAEFGGGVEYSDMLGLGLWGEYHFNNWDGSTPAGVRVPSAGAYKWAADLWHEFFAPLGPLVFTLKAPSFHADAGEANAYACNSLRWGWRTDGWGDPWHHAVYYPAAIKENGLENWWKVNLVALEPAGVFQGWNANNYAIAYDFARLHRATKYHNKGMSIPGAELGRMRSLFNDATGWAARSVAAQIQTSSRPYYLPAHSADKATLRPRVLAEV